MSHLKRRPLLRDVEAVRHGGRRVLPQRVRVIQVDQLHAIAKPREPLERVRHEWVGHLAGRAPGQLRARVERRV